jgi:hypothetical protein
VPFFCYIHRNTGGVPHFEVLPEVSEQNAILRAWQLLADRMDGERAEIWLGDTLVATVARAAA